MKSSPSRKLFLFFCGTFLIVYAVLCLLPIVQLAALSFSSKAKADAGLVALWPAGFTTGAYNYIFSNGAYLGALLNSLQRLLVGVPLSMLLTLLAAFPLSRPQRQFLWRSKFCWYFVITILFSGGLIPLYMLVSSLQLKDTIWALVLPNAVPVFNVILLINFFRQIPEEIYEASIIDGAGQFRILFNIYVPLSIPSLATLTIFVVVGHWNSWFDGLIFMSNISKYPLQTYLQSVVISKVDITFLLQNPNLSDQTVGAARLLLGIIPIIAIYLSLQRYFVKGLTLGGVKG